MHLTRKAVELKNAQRAKLKIFQNAHGVEGLPKCVETSQQHALDGQLQDAARSERFDTGLMEMRPAKLD